MSALDDKTSSGNFFEDFRLGQTIRHATPRTMTGGDVALYTGLFGSRFAVQSSRAFATAIGYPRRADRRPAGVPHRVRQDRAGHLAQRGRQSRLRRRPVPGAGVSRRHADRDLRGDRAEGELQPQDRRGLCAHPRLQAGRHRRARIRALGDGAKARRGRARAGRPRAAAAHGGRSEAAGRRLPADRRERLRLRAGRQPAPLRRLSGRREDRPRRRRHRRGGRAPDRDAALPEHRAHPLRPVFGGAEPLRPAADLRRARDLAGARAVVQRARQRVPHRRHQRRPPRRAAVRRLHGVRLVGGAGDERTAGPRPTSARCGCARSPPRTGRARISR